MLFGAVHVTFQSLNQSISLFNGNKWGQYHNFHEQNKRGSQKKKENKPNSRRNVKIRDSRRVPIFYPPCSKSSNRLTWLSDIDKIKCLNAIFFSTRTPRHIYWVVLHKWKWVKKKVMDVSDLFHWTMFLDVDLMQKNNPFDFIHVRTSVLQQSC